MGQEQDASFYDGRLDKVALPLEQSPWLSVYALTADLLPLPASGVGIADLGCGTGRLAKLLQVQGHARYLGIDFSVARIEEARGYVPEFDFEVGDLFDETIVNRLQDFGAFAALEVLEHVNGDLDIVRALPSGATVVFSVPNYDSAGHVRTFPTAEAAAERYGELLEIDSLAVLPRRKVPRKIFVLRGVRR